MGAALGIPELPVAGIQSCAEKVTTTFTPLYTKQYGLSLAKHIEQSKTAPKQRTYLQSPPPASEPLKMGFLTKQGGATKNWKKRYFVALNEKDNFEVRYFVDEATYKADKAPKGKINLCWYRVESGDEATTTAEDKKTEEKFEIILKPWSSWDRRRTWYIHCADAEEKKAWMDVFQIACNKARAPKNPDPVADAAFNQAYRNTRWELGEWGWYYCCANEEQQLAMLVASRCERDVMGETYAKIPASAANLVRPKITAAMDKTIGAAVEAAWKSVAASIEKSAPSLKVKAEESIGPVCDKKIELKSTVSNAISGALTPAVNAAAGKVVPIVTAALLSALLKAETSAINTFITEMQKLITTGAGAAGSGAGAAPVDGSSWSKGIKEFTRETYWYWGILHDAIQPIRDFGYKKAMAPVTVGGKTINVDIEQVASLLHGIDIWRIASDFEDAVRSQARMAAFTLDTLVTEQPGADKNVLLSKVVAMYIHDAKIVAYESVHNVFLQLLLSPINKEVTPAIQSALEPIKSAIPEALASFLDLDEMVEQIMEDSIGSVVDTTVIPETATFFAELDSVLSKANTGDVTVPNFQTTLTSGLPAFE